MVTDADIAPALGEPDLEKAAERLIELALAGGGFDNVTVVIGELVEDGSVPDDSGPSDLEATRIDRLSALAEPQLVGSAAQATRKREPGAQTAATLAPPPDPEELRYSYVPPERTRWLRYGLAIAVVLLAAVIAAVAVFQWTQRQYYVGTDSGKVAIYRGVQANVPLIAVHSVDERTDIDVSRLPNWQRSQVTEGIEAMDRADAERTVAALRALLPPKDDKRDGNTKEGDKDTKDDKDSASPSPDSSDGTPTPAPSP
jgi:protein phosphatase